MNCKTKFRFAGLAVVVMLSAACTSSSAQVRSSPGVPIHSFAGGCAGTVLTDALPPMWAQAGWNQPSAPWGVPWALGTGGDAVAYVFATQLVAGSSPRVDGTNNKVLWVAKGGPPNFVVAAHPLGVDQPVVTIDGGPSIVDLPTAGCWTFHLTWGLSGQLGGSIINLEVLPTGSAQSLVTFQLLNARPLKLPIVAAGSPCPTSPVTLLGGMAPRVGTPLRLGFGNTLGPHGAFAFNKTVLDFATPPLSAEVLLRGSRLDAVGKMYFGGPGVASNQTVAISVTDPQGGDENPSIASYSCRLKTAPSSTRIRPVRVAMASRLTLSASARSSSLTLSERLATQFGSRR